MDLTPVVRHLLSTRSGRARLPFICVPLALGMLTDHAKPAAAPPVSETFTVEALKVSPRTTPRVRVDVNLLEMDGASTETNLNALKIFVPAQAKEIHWNKANATNQTVMVGEAASFHWRAGTIDLSILPRLREHSQDIELIILGTVKTFIGYELEDTLRQQDLGSGYPRPPLLQRLGYDQSDNARDSAVRAGVPPAPAGSPQPIFHLRQNIITNVVPDGHTLLLGTGVQVSTNKHLKLLITPRVLDK